MRVIRSASLVALLCVVAMAPSALAQQVTPDDGAAAPALSGQIVAAGKCPVPVGGIEGGSGRTCPDRPFQTTVLILTADAQQQVASVPTAVDGTFSVSLSPGQYVVDPLLADGSSPVSAVNVAVPDDGFVTIRVTGGSAERVPPNS
jgi:hypothetical protein